jgi:hypothetical protein
MFDLTVGSRSFAQAWESTKTK